MIESLPRREREVFEALCGLGEATAAAVRGAMGDPPSDSAVRTLLGRLEAKGLIDHRTLNQAYVYAPVPQADAVAETALQRLVHTFFQGSAARAATALLGMEKGLAPDEIEALQQAIDKARGDAE
ncbi:BlaI/MecI/CopY family transcriptional regulator [Sphingomonas sp. HITSZ_GF]|uniref:BlaI/MecI/CopY family transcriptional regulator n=1 Tax=Sphingomonas sp. HITSZ_GF TaxID=3037247 RepID=UPI00240E72E7|nr:BlaI/MecI/CopY family transcriptional regulator [Sphingomonas sp. HITSZ_GF]MDG2534712.1 BlaI/MecI/CopY family transcriptional regulator [Sphingomonas sp. HITSZ_GF]